MVYVSGGVVLLAFRRRPPCRPSRRRWRPQRRSIGDKAVDKAGQAPSQYRVAALTLATSGLADARVAFAAARRAYVEADAQRGCHLGLARLAALYQQSPPPPPPPPPPSQLVQIPGSGRTITPLQLMSTRAARAGDGRGRRGTRPCAPW